MMFCMLFTWRKNIQQEQKSSSSSSSSESNFLGMLFFRLLTDEGESFVFFYPFSMESD